jgi:4-amino-4-deoxy-L-arabinose transferase-like glycosyltransferase
MTISLNDTKTKFVLILVLALILRLVAISSRPIWYDESFSILLAEKGPAEILRGTLATDSNSSAAEEHPPAYYFMLWGWMEIFGSSLLAVRLLSVSVSLGIILCIYQISRHLFDPATALTAAFLSAILPFQIHYGQEIRMYVLLTFWLCLATLAFLKRQWILFSLAAALAQYTHNLAAFYLIPLAFTPIFQKDWKTLRSLTFSAIGAVIIYSPWIVHLPAQLLKVTSSFWIEKPGVDKLFTLFLLYLPHLPLPNTLLMPSLLVSTLTLAIAAFQTYRAQKGDSKKTAKGLWLAYLSFAPPLLLWWTSQISPIYVERALLPSHAIFCIWLAWVLIHTKLPPPIALFTFILILSSAGIGFYEHVTYKGFPYGPFSALDQNIQKRLKPGDVIIHSNKLTFLPSFYFNPALPQTYIIDTPGSSTDTLSPATQKILHLSNQKNIATASVGVTRIWLIIFQKSIDEFKSHGFTTHPQIDYLNSNFILTTTEVYDDVRVYLFTRKTP